MGRKKAKDTLEIAENIYLKKPNQGEVWHYYFSLDGFQFRASTGTKDKSRAIHVCMNAYYAAHDRKRSGAIADKISFRRLSKKYLESLKGQNKEKFHREVLHRHFMKFFGKFEDISKINEGLLNDYLIYRREKSDYTVLNQSLNKENVVFNQMMRMAHEYGWIADSIKIKRQSEVQSYNRRAHFTRSEYARLLKVSRRRVREYSDPSLSAKKRGILTAKYWNRYLLHDVILIIANSGIRVDEIKTVTWRDIDWQNNTITLRSAGKVKSSRVLLVRKHGMHALKSLMSRRKAYTGNHKAFNDHERIHSLPNGVFVGSMKKGFNELLQECGFKYATIKDKHTLTSLRHTYATLRLTTKGSRVSMRGLAKQMGTSQGMIEKHYGHDVINDYKDELLGQ